MNVKPKHPHAPGSRALRKAENAKRREAETVKIQAETIALRISMALDWTAVVRFAGGAHDVRVVRADAIPAGYAESRIAIRERGNLPALRFVGAERVAAILRETLDRNRDGSRRVVSPPLRRRA